MTRLLTHMAHLGSKANLRKSRLDPSQQVTYLGMDLDTVTMNAGLSTRRVDNILASLTLLRAGRMVLYVQLLLLAGKLTAAASVYLWAYWPSTLFRGG